MTIFLLKDIKFVFKDIPTKLTPDLVSFIGEFYPVCKGEIAILHKPLENGKGYEVSSILIPKLDKEIIRNENYRGTSFINTDINVLNWLLAYQIQQYIKGIIHRGQVRV